MANKMRIFASVEDVYQALSDGIKINEKFSFSHPTKTEGKLIKLSLGRIWFNLILPVDLPLVNEPITKSGMNSIINKMRGIYPPDELSTYLTKINKEAFRMSSYIPSSFSIDSMILSDEVEKEKKELRSENITDPVELDQKIAKITEKVTSELNSNGSRINNFNLSSAKPVPWSSLLVAHGYVADVEGNIRGPVKTALTDGHKPEDFYTTAAESRRGFYYKAAVSSKPGYLSRRTTMANANIQIDDSIKDCGSKEYFKIQVDSKLAKILGERYIYENGRVKLMKNANDYIGKTINLRSPLYCKSENGICPICYGKSWEALENKNIGILVGGDINNKALNAYMSVTRLIMKSYYIFD